MVRDGGWKVRGGGREEVEGEGWRMGGGRWGVRGGRGNKNRKSL